ncbi:MAG TPA: ATP-dependent protease ATPase subunit HslU [Tissierellales bacterium]|nr:ATP-dependent protease ATPase subunit HslU [Tissierellales bacterium]
MKNLTPSQVVLELDKYIIGQERAKKVVAIALRNRYRRNKLDIEFKEEIKPKNILMMGPTGVGKTEIARRLSKLVDAPFVKVEATKFTEVGYIGRDVDSMVRDLVEASIRIVKAEKLDKVYDKSEVLAEEKIIHKLAPLPAKKVDTSDPIEYLFGALEEGKKEEKEDIEKRRKEMENVKFHQETLRKKLKNGELDNEIIEIEVEESLNSTVEYFSGIGMEELNIDMSDIFGSILPKQTRKRKTTVKEAKKIISAQEAQKLVDMDEVIREAISRAEENGIIFIDEIDKIAGKEYGSNVDVSREGVQRDILPIIEGSTVVTKYGPVKTDYMLFIAAGAFHVSKVSDLIPEIQGRFPLRVELDSLTKGNFKEILTKPKNALTKQYQLLMETEGVRVDFTDEALDEIANFAYISNQQSENIGARRLHTVLERLFEDISFNAPDLENKEVVIDENYVKEKLMSEIQQKDISKYIL